MGARTSPRKRIVESRKEGTWGDVEWVHVLECGHIDVRKRKARGEFLACDLCAKAQNFKSRTRALLDPDEPDTGLDSVLEPEVQTSDAEVLEWTIAFAQALGVPSSQVQMNLTYDFEEGRMRPGNTLVMFRGDDVERILRGE